MKDLSEDLENCYDYMKDLEEERRKIEAFQRELPLCLDLVTQAIETCKQQLSRTTTTTQECSEQISSVVPVFEEFIPIKRPFFNSEEQASKKKFKIDCNKEVDDQNCKKSNWLRSVQLWNQTPDPISQMEFPNKIGGSDLKLNDSSAFHPFREENDVTGISPTIRSAAPLPSTSCSADIGGENSKRSKRKKRRAWSPELHRRFLQALRELGGAHVATPKQIKELMKVDELTNDEVKSHLQKYRLHMSSRPIPSTANNTPTQTPQFVVLSGGIWVPPPPVPVPEYDSMTTTTTSTEESCGAILNKLYAPIAALPPSFQEPPPSPIQTRLMLKLSDDRGSSYRNGAGQSFSPASSSSTHSAAVSPAC